MKTTIRIPVDQYAFIEQELDVDISASEIKKVYENLKEAMSTKASDIDFYSFLCEIINSDLQEWGTIDDYNALTQKQKDVMQSLKRYCKRIKYNEQ